MKELVIISGKGGTGKTTLTASLAFLAKQNVLTDCDVDAADLHILAHPRIKHEEDFFGGVKAVIDSGKCTDCGLCRDACRYDAISEAHVVERLSCEGCGVCSMAVGSFRKPVWDPWFMQPCSPARRTRANSWPWCGTRQRSWQTRSAKT
ncbi:4Fe-4S binding protein [Thermodesulfobacteriota bacterium]